MMVTRLGAGLTLARTLGIQVLMMMTFMLRVIMQYNYLSS